MKTNGVEVVVEVTFSPRKKQNKDDKTSTNISKKFAKKRIACGCFRWDRRKEEKERH